MWIDVAQARLALHAGRTARLQLAARTRLVGIDGQCWITLDHDQRDIVLGPGDEFVVAAASGALAGALRPHGQAELLVSAP